MMKKEKLVWRLGKLPNIEELRDLVKDKIITQDEVREILFSKETEEEKDKDSEIKFLREMVTELSRHYHGTVYVPTRYWTSPWMTAYTTNAAVTGSNITLTSGNSSTVSMLPDSTSTRISTTYLN